MTGTIAPAGARTTSTAATQQLRRYIGGEVRLVEGQHKLAIGTLESFGLTRRSLVLNLGNGYAARIRSGEAYQSGCGKTGELVLSFTVQQRTIRFEFDPPPRG